MNRPISGTSNLNDEDRFNERSLARRLMIASLTVSADRSEIEADPVSQALLGVPAKQPFNSWLATIEPVELHTLIGKVEIDCATVLVRDIAGIFTPAKLWQYRYDESSSWQIAIQIELQNANEDNPLEKRFFAQQQLLSIISHELRTPAATLKMLIDDLSSEKLEEQLPLLRQTSEHLMSVMQDMQQAINPSKNLPLQMRVFHPNRLLENVTSQVRRAAQAQSIKLRMTLNEDELTRVETDLERCKLIAINLLKNAILHSEGSETQISARVITSELGEPLLELRVSDDGIGISETEIDRMLQPFERLHGLEQGGEGAGLGLFVVWQSVKELKGSFTLSKSDQGGLLAVAQIPCRLTRLDSSPKQNPVTESQGFQEKLSRLRVLVVEDDPVIRMVSQKLLSKRVALVDVAENGAVGLEKINQAEYDLILSDYFMPVMDGAEMIRRIRASGITTPIISVTAAVLGDEAQVLRNAGANHILPKPISMKAFIEAVEQL